MYGLQKIGEIVAYLYLNIHCIFWLSHMAIFGSGYDYFLGYALSGGGARGFAHLGTLKVLEQYGLKPDVIAGTSAGALAGVFYADGFQPDEIVELFRKREFREFVSFTCLK